MTKAVTDETFAQEVLQSDIPVLVDFFAEWCGPCKAMAPALDEVAKELEGQVKIVKVDVDKNSKTAQTYKVRGVPTLLMFKGAEATQRQVGALVQKTKLREWIDTAVAGSAEPEAPPVPPVITAFKLENGMDVVAMESKQAQDITHMLFFGSGMADAPLESPGVAMLASRMVAGAAAVSGGKVRRILSTETVTFMQRTSKEMLPEVMQRSADCMRGLRLAEDEVAEEKRRIAEEAAKRPPVLAGINLLWKIDAELFAGHPYGVSLGDADDNVAHVSTVEAQRFLERYLNVGNAALVVLGAISADEVKSLAAATYGSLPATGAVQRSRQRPAADGARRVMVSGAEPGKEMFIRKYVVPSYAAAEPGEGEALQLLSHILVSGRLRDRLVSEQKVATTVKSGYDSGDRREFGMFQIIARASTGEIEPVEAGVDAVLEEYGVSGPSEAELEQARERLSASRGDFDEAAFVYRYGNNLVLGREPGPSEARSDALSRVTADDVKRVVQLYLNPRQAVTGWLVSEGGSSASPGEEAA